MRKKTTKLYFSEEEPADEAVCKAAGKAEKAADQADKAKTKLEWKRPQMAGKLRYGMADHMDKKSDSEVKPQNQRAARDYQAALNAENARKKKTVDNGALAGGDYHLDDSFAAIGPKAQKEAKQKGRPDVTASVGGRLRFDADSVERKTPRKQYSHLAARTVGDMVSAGIHQKISEDEEENVGLQAAHESGRFAKGTACLADSLYYGRQLRQYNKAARLERKVDKANVEMLYQQQMAENPDAGSNLFSRWRQRQEIKKQYAAAKTVGGAAHSTAAAKGARGASKAVGETKSAFETMGGFAAKHPKTLLTIFVAFALVMILGGVCSASSVLFSSITNGVLGTSYTAENEDIAGAEADFAALETALQAQIAGIESTHSGYDEYRYSLDEIGHDPYQLASVLTVLY